MAGLPALLAVAVLLVGACGGSPAPSPGQPVTGASATPATPAGPTVAPSVGPASSPAPSSAGPAGPSPSASGAQPASSPSGAAGTADWPVYHRDAARTGLDPAFPALRGPLAVAWSRPLDGAVYAEPLVVSGAVIAATENDTVYALDPASGRVLWTRHLGSPVRLSSLPCGNIDPLGITGTPAFDPLSGSLFAVAEVQGPRHLLFALDPSNGLVRWSRGIDLPGDDPATHQQRPALAVANGYVYVGLGGLAGDCGQYRGEVVGVPTSGQGTTIAYRVPVAREAAVWATPGPAIDASGNVYVSLGNGSSTTTYDGSDSVLELSPALQLRSRFAPSTWARDNATDADLGSLGPVLVPGGLIFIAGKSGTGYTLRQGSLGGIGGQVASAPICGAFGGAARLDTTVFVPCQGGLRAVRIGTDGSIHVAWHTGSGADGSPVVGGGAVWSLDLGAGVLYRLDPATGTATGDVSVGAVPHFASPALWGGRVLVGTMRGVVSVGAAG